MTSNSKPHRPELANPNPLNAVICGLYELAIHSNAGVTHVLSLVDPELEEIKAFSAYPHHSRTVLKFNDIIAPSQGRVMPSAEHIEAILRFGDTLTTRPGGQGQPKPLVHCHVGVSRSTAATLVLLAQANANNDENWLFATLKTIRPQAWPNSVMVRLADEALGRNGRLFDALCRHYGEQMVTFPDLGRWMAGIGRQAEVDLAVLPA